MFNRKDYEQLSDSLQTSGEILYAIECVTGCDFKPHKNRFDTVAINHAFGLWEEGGRDGDILAALPLEDGCVPILDGKEVSWGLEGKFAEFDGEKWTRSK